MTKKHFIKMAQKIADHKKATDRLKLAIFIIPICQECNSDFKLGIFLEACNIDYKKYMRAI